MAGISCTIGGMFEKPLFGCPEDAMTCRAIFDVRSARMKWDGRLRGVPFFAFSLRP
jgi:hypothetical protein